MRTRSPDVSSRRRAPAVLLAGAALATSLVSSPPAAAEVPDDLEYGTVVTPRRGPGSPFDVDRTIHRVGDDALLSEQPIDPLEAVESLPGVQPQRTQRGAGAPILRGLVGPQNLLLLDGVRLGTSIHRTGPNQYAVLVDPLALSAIEVLLGPGSVLYGSDALGGTVAYQTLGLPGAEGWWGRATTRFASADLATELGITAGGRDGGLAGWLGGSIRRRGDLRTGDGDVLPRSDYLQGDWRGKLGLELGQGWSLTGTWLGTRLPDAVRLDAIGQGDQREYDNLDSLAFLTLRRERPRSVVSDVTVQLAWHHVDDRVDRFQCATDGDDRVIDLDACLARDRGQLDFLRRTEDTARALLGSATLTAGDQDGRWRLLAGVDGSQEWIGSRRWDGRPADDFRLTEAARGNFSDGSTYGAAAAFLHGEGRFFLGPPLQVVLTGGARLSHIAAAAPDVPGLGDVDHAFTGTAFSAGARAILFERANLFANFSQGFRAPNLQEATVLGDTGSTFEIPNADLGPERADTLEVGLKWRSEALHVQAAAFRSTVSDAIVREAATWEGASEVGGKPVYRRTNASEADYRGLELAASTGDFHGFRAFGTLAALRGTVTTVAGEREPARRVPPLNGLAGVGWESPWKRLRARAAVRWAAAQDRLAPGDTEDLRICEDPARIGTLLGDCRGTDGWVSLDLRAGLEPTPGLRVDLAVENVLDASYRWHGSGIDAPGVDARLGVTWEW